MIPVTADDLERIAFDTGAEISLGGRVPTLRIGRLTFGAVTATQPAALDPAALGAVS